MVTDLYVRAVATALDGWFGPAWIEPSLLGLAGHIDEAMGEIRRAQMAAVEVILANPTEYDDSAMDHLWYAKSMSEQKVRLIGELWDTLRVLDLWEDFISAHGRLSRGVCDDEGVRAMGYEYALGAKTDQEILDAQDEDQQELAVGDYEQAFLRAFEGVEDQRLEALQELARFLDFELQAEAFAISSLISAARDVPHLYTRMLKFLNEGQAARTRFGAARDKLWSALRTQGKLFDYETSLSYVRAD